MYWLTVGCYIVRRLKPHSNLVLYSAVRFQRALTDKDANMFPQKQCRSHVIYASAAIGLVIHSFWLKFRIWFEATEVPSYPLPPSGLRYCIEHVSLSTISILQSIGFRTHTRLQIQINMPATQTPHNSYSHTIQPQRFHILRIHSMGTGHESIMRIRIIHTTSARKARQFTKKKTTKDVNVVECVCECEALTRILPFAFRALFIVQLVYHSHCSKFLSR